MPAPDLRALVDGTALSDPKFHPFSLGQGRSSSRVDLQSPARTPNLRDATSGQWSARELIANPSETTNNRPVASDFRRVPRAHPGLKTARPHAVGSALLTLLRALGCTAAVTLPTPLHPDLKMKPTDDTSRSSTTIYVVTSEWLCAHLWSPKV